MTSWAVNLWFLEHPDRTGIFNLGSGRAQPFNDVAHATVNACRARRGEPPLSVAQLVAQEILQYVPFPEALVGKYQCVTQADLSALRAVGCDLQFVDVGDRRTALRRLAERAEIGLSCQSMSSLPESLTRKIIAASELDGRTWKRPLVFTNGVFDVLHRGHVTYLATAHYLGSSLLVGVNSDFSARGLGKGPDRPLNNEMDRLLVLAALESVSYVALFDEPTPCALLERCKPDVYVRAATMTWKRLRKRHWSDGGAVAHWRSLS